MPAVSRHAFAAPVEDWAFHGQAFETGGISPAAWRFFALGGLGIIIGDGRLDHYDREDVIEAHYADRGPVSVLGLRLHGDFWRSRAALDCSNRPTA